MSLGLRAGSDLCDRPKNAIHETETQNLMLSASFWITDVKNVQNGSWEAVI